MSSFSSGDDRIGILFNYQDANNFNSFLLRSDGSYWVSRYSFGHTPLVNWTQSDAIEIGDGAVNILEITGENGSYSFYINGKYMAQIEDKTWPSGGVGLFGGSNELPATHRLESIRICG